MSIYMTPILLGLAICAVWLPSIPIGARLSIPAWTPLFAITVAVGIGVGNLSWIAAGLLAIFIGSAWATKHLCRAMPTNIAVVLVLIIALAMALHLIPGFLNPAILNNIQLSSDARPLTLYGNIDKGAAGLVLAAIFAKRVTNCSEWRKLLGPTLLASLVTTTTVIGIALAIGYVRFEPKIPACTPAFLAINLLFTCVPEDAFFHGIIQERLMIAFERRHCLNWLPVAISTALFGLAHAAGGIAFLGLSTLAGLGYSFAYAKTRKIEASILVHFLLNTVHFLGFTYPAISH